MLYEVNSQFHTFEEDNSRKGVSIQHAARVSNATEREPAPRTVACKLVATDRLGSAHPALWSGMYLDGQRSRCAHKRVGARREYFCSSGNHHLDHSRQSR